MERSRIKRLGPILHFTDLGNAIIKKPQKLPKIGSDIVTEDLQHVGKVIDIFGPVNAPYVSIRIRDDCKDIVGVGSKLYAIERQSYFDKRKNKKKKITKTRKRSNVRSHKTKKNK